MLGRMSHDGVTTAMHAAVPQMSSEYMHQPGYNNASGGEQNVPMWHHDSSLMPATQLHPITEHPEPSGTGNEQQQQQQAGKVRRNIFSGFRRVAKAVKTAAVATSRSEVFRKESIDQLYQPPVIMSTRTDQPQPQSQPQFALYPGVRASPTNAAGNWTNDHSESIAYSPRRTTMPAVASTDDHVPRVLPISQPGPRQRSLTQQAPVSPIARIYSEGTGPSRSIDFQRNTNSLEPAASSAMLGSGLPYSRPSDPPARISPLASALSPSRFLQRRSPDASHSSINSSASTGSMQAYHLGAMNRSYDLSQSRRQPATPHTARSADAIPRMTSPVTTATALAKPTVPVLDIYPKRDRSMTLPSEPSNTYRQTNVGSSLAPPPLPPRSAPRLRSYSGMPPSTRNTQVPLALTLGPEKIELSISGSPLFKPQADEGRVHSAGEFIHEQAVQNMSLADISRDPSSSSGGSDDQLMLQLPPPAAASDQPADKAEVMVDAPQYVSMMINSDKLKNYLKQVSDGEQAAEYESMIRTMEAHEKTKSSGRNRQSVILDSALEKSEIPAANNDSGVQVDDSQPTGLGGMVLASQDTYAIGDSIESEHDGSMERIDDSKHMAAVRETGSTTPLSASTSRFSLPVVSNSSSNGGMAEPASIVGSPPSPFSFSHSRYSLINQDGSLNLASFQFDQLDGYQKRLSGSMGSLGATANAPGSSLPQRSESKITDRLTRRANNGDGGWFRSTLALSSSENHRERSTSPPPLVPARSPHLPFSSSAGDRLEMYVPDNNAVRQSKLMRKARKPSSFALSTGSGGSGELPAMMGSAGVPLGVFNFSMSMDGQQARQQARVSESSYSGGERSNSSRRPSQTLYPSFSVNPVNRRPSDNTSIASQHSLYRPNNSSRTHLFADKPAQRLMHLGDISPFDMVYRSSVGSMSLEQALTLVEGTTDPTNNQQQQQQSRMSRHRRLHKRSASALNANELDDIMIQTAEMCHSIQTAIKMQRASESGLGRWIQAAFGEPQKPVEEEEEEEEEDEHGDDNEDETERPSLEIQGVPLVVETEHHSPATTSGPLVTEIEHLSLETVAEPQDVPQIADDPESVQDLRIQQPMASSTSEAPDHPDHDSDDNGGYASSSSSSESSLDIWPGSQTHRQHLGGDTNSVTSSDESIDISDPVQTSLPPSPCK
ncbi:hypothetical protein LPJ53_003764 [Coemansia erecta]|uniref:Uncharacterized protein n=1 Tax=Coemansia erecta TaxID=147472 RepID=A0A9W8CS39_9FUNG|nr:hypothetical protein LPJ53_003764 [Coemansia erecta]